MVQDTNYISPASVAEAKEQGTLSIGSGSTPKRKRGGRGWVRDLVAPAFLFYILRQKARILRILNESRTHRWPRILMILVMLAKANEPGTSRQ